MLRTLHGCALAVLGVTASACQTPSLSGWAPGMDTRRMTRVNLRPDGVFLKSSAPTTLPVGIPAGSPAVIVSFTETGVDMKIREVIYTMSPTTGRFDTSQAGIERFIDKYLISTADAPSLEKLEPTELLFNVKQGDVVRGMSKEQVYVALGPPRWIDDKQPAVNLSRKDILASDRWTYVSEQIVGLIPQTVIYVFGGGKLETSVK